ncbi:MAG: PQQ-binding-like beta-propeller repeat protein [Oligoflexales bacterium]
MLYWLFKSAVAISGVLASHAGASRMYHIKPALGFPKPESVRPFRVRSLSMAPQYDAQKPLAPFDRTGWVNLGPLIVGEGENEQVTCYSFEQGSVLWRLENPRRLQVPPVMVGGHVLLGFLDGSLLKVEVATGKIRWKLQLADAVSRQLTVTRDAVYVVTESQSFYEVGLEDGKIQWVVDANDGGKSVHINSLAAPFVYDGVVHVGLRSGEWMSVVTRTGQVLRKIDPHPLPKRKFHDFVGPAVVVTGRVVFARHDGFIGSVSLSDMGQVSWEKVKAPISAAAFRDGRFYIGLVNGDVFSYEAEKGTETKLAETGSPIVGLSVGSDSLYISNQIGDLFALDRSSGDLKWRDNVGSPVTQPPLVIGKTIYFPSSMKVLYGYRLTN